MKNPIITVIFSMAAYLFIGGFEARAEKPSGVKQKRIACPSGSSWKIEKLGNDEDALLSEWCETKGKKTGPYILYRGLPEAYEDRTLSDFIEISPVITGSFKNGTPVGKWSCKSDSQDKEDDFELKDGNGVFKDWDEDCRVIRIGAYKDGKRSGEWKTFSSLGELKFACTYRSGIITGKTILYDPKKKGRMEFFYLRGKKHGLAISYDKTNARQATIEYRNGKMHGAYTIYSRGKIISEDKYKNGRKHGYSIVYFENGNIQAKCMYKNGKSTGVCKEWFINGKIKIKCKFHNGQRNGKCVSYHESGIMKHDCTFLKGKPHGRCRAWGDSGLKILDAKFRHGNQI